MTQQRKHKNKKLTKIELTDEQVQKKAYIMHTDELEKRLDQTGEDLAQLAMYGSTKDLLKLSWENYELFKKGMLPQYFQDGEEEVQQFYDDKRKELILKFTTFIDIASNHLIDEDKLKKASLKEVSSSIKTALDMLQALVGKETHKVVENKHTMDVALSEQQINEKLKTARDKLNAVDADFEVDPEPEEPDPTAF